MDFTVREYTPADIPAMTAIWNSVVADGNAFPQENQLTISEAADFFASQSYCAVAAANKDGKDASGSGCEVVGLYILHPNNIERCGHIANASFAVDRTRRGCHIGHILVANCLERAKTLGFRVLQFNAVVAENTGAIKLYEELGFVRLGVIPGGFRSDSGYSDIILFYHTL